MLVLMSLQLALKENNSVSILCGCSATDKQKLRHTHPLLAYRVSIAGDI